MTLSIRFLPEARAEFDVAVDWYEQRQAGLGATFLQRVEAALNLIANQPGAGRVVHRDARQVVVAKFPYVVVYRVDAAEVIVISVHHTSRDPALWRVRVP